MTSCLNAGTKFPHARSPQTRSDLKNKLLSMPSTPSSGMRNISGTSGTRSCSQAVLSLPSPVSRLKQGEVQSCGDTYWGCTLFLFHRRRQRFFKDIFCRELLLSSLSLKQSTSGVESAIAWTQSIHSNRPPGKPGGWQK